MFIFRISIGFSIHFFLENQEKRKSCFSSRRKKIEKNHENLYKNRKTKKVSMKSEKGKKIKKQKTEFDGKKLEKN